MSLFRYEADSRNPTFGTRLFILTTAFVLCILVAFRFQILNGFTLLPGDRFDAVISASILEHWYNFFSGNAVWSELNYFYPYKNTIAQTDAYFLIGVLYTPFRAIGIDPFLSSELASIVIKAIGFSACFVLARKYFKFDFWYALLIAVLFTMNNGMTMHNSRIQLSTVAFLPLMAILMAEFFSALQTDKKRYLFAVGSIAGTFFAAWCFTCFYMAWFFVYLTTFLFVFFVITQTGWLRKFLFNCRRHAPIILAILVVTMIALLPFLSVYLPKAAEVGMRSYESVSTFMLPVQGVLEVGAANIVLGEVYAQIMAIVSPNYKVLHEYANTGFSMPLFGLFAYSVFQIFRRRELRETIWLPLVCASLLTWGLSLKIGSVSGWYWVYSYFPGAKALNVVAIYQIFLSLPVILVAVRLFALIKISRAVLVLTSLFLIACELNVPYLNLYRHTELARIQLDHDAPQDCKVFFVSPWDGQDKIPGYSDWINNFYPHNVTAIMLAQKQKLPTINGIASFNPKDWDFAAVGNVGYEERIRIYASRHQISNLCKLDLNTKEWSHFH